MKASLLLAILATVPLAPAAHAQHKHDAPSAPQASAPAPGGRPVGGRPGMREWTRQPLLLGRPVRTIALPP